MLLLIINDDFCIWKFTNVWRDTLVNIKICILYLVNTSSKKYVFLFNVYESFFFKFSK